MIEVYHGSTQIIKHPDVARGRDNLDFGKAFYVTKIKSQAMNWAHIVYSRYEENAPIVNTYALDLEAIDSNAYCKLVFTAYDSEWLNFIVASRMWKKPWKDFDYIEGGHSKRQSD